MDFPTSSANHMSETKAPTVASCRTHTMGDSLHGYLDMKMDRDIILQNWSYIHVKGEYDRTNAIVSKTEKHDKPFNWQRPTFRKTGDELEVLCFPGVDYVEHYAAITATYLALNGKPSDIVRYTSPKRHESLKLFLESNLREMGAVDIVIVGYVHGLGSGAWEGGGGDKIFAWNFLTTGGNFRAALLGCTVSFWGDIAGDLVRALHCLNNSKCVLYVGKLGALRPCLEPNKWIATGSSSDMQGVQITWNNVLEEVVANRKPVIFPGKHCSLPSVLDETQEWLRVHKGKFDFIDPDIGHMAVAANECHIGFGYLHMISDNLAKKYPYDLSNERLQKVRLNRQRLLQEIQATLNEFITRWSSNRHNASK